jgi:hypothetical protein
VYDGHGNRKEDPIHVIVPGKISVPMKIQKHMDSGLAGLLEVIVIIILMLIQPILM